MDEYLPDFMKKNGQYTPYNPEKERLDQEAFQRAMSIMEAKTANPADPTLNIPQEGLKSAIQEGLNPKPEQPQQDPSLPPPVSPKAGELGQTLSTPQKSALTAVAQETQQPPEKLLEMGVRDANARVAKVQPAIGDPAGETYLPVNNPTPETTSNPMTMDNIAKQLADMQKRQSRTDKASIAGGVLGALGSIIGGGLMAAGRAKGKAGLLQAGDAVSRSGGALNQLMQVPGANLQERVKNLQDQYNTAHRNSVAGRQAGTQERLADNAVRRTDLMAEAQPTELEAREAQTARLRQATELDASKEQRAQLLMDQQAKDHAWAMGQPPEVLVQAIKEIDPKANADALLGIPQEEVAQRYLALLDGERKRRGGRSGPKPAAGGLPPREAWSAQIGQEISRANPAWSHEQVMAEVNNRWNNLDQKSKDILYRPSREYQDDNLSAETTAAAIDQDFGAIEELLQNAQNEGTGDRLGNMLSSVKIPIPFTGQSIRPPTATQNFGRLETEVIGVAKKLAQALEDSNRGVTDADARQASSMLAAELDSMDGAFLLAAKPEYVRAKLEEARNMVKRANQARRQVRGLPESGTDPAASTDEPVSDYVPVRYLMQIGEKDVGYQTQVKRDLVDRLVAKGLVEVVE